LKAAKAAKNEGPPQDPVSTAETYVASVRAAEPRVDVWSGALEARLAEDAADLDAAQALRYRVFYEEMGATPSPAIARARRDFDRFDDICDHLLVVDHAAEDKVIGTYRLLRRSIARRHGGFYSAAEFDLARLDAHPGELLELGRSCVDAAARNRPTIELLWRAIAAYVFAHRVPLMFGCASLPGADPQALAAPLSYLHTYYLAPPALRVSAVPARFIDMRRLAPGEFDAARTLAGLPPLLKAYLRLGGFVGDGAVIDREFNTTDVCVLVHTDLISEKYYRHYGRSARKGRAGR
jgi:L-ornithine Nalpha-acyltransferase